MADYLLIKDLPFCKAGTRYIKNDGLISNMDRCSYFPDKIGMKHERFAIHQDWVENNTEWFVSMSEIINKAKSISGYRSDIPQHTDNKDWEILSYLSSNYTPIFLKDFPNPDRTLPIHSVKRLSDGEVFTIGDIVFSKVQTEDDYFQIHKFQVVNEIVIYANSCPFDNLVKLPKQKQILFRTENGRPIHKGDSFWWVDTDIYTFGWSIADEITNKMYFHNHKTFNSESDAKEYIIMNKPCLSVKEVIDFSKLNGIGFRHDNGECVHHEMSIDIIKLKEKVKSKLP